MVGGVLINVVTIITELFVFCHLCLLTVKTGRSGLSILPENWQVCTLSCLFKLPPQGNRNNNDKLNFYKCFTCFFCFSCKYGATCRYNHPERYGGRS